MLKTKDSISFIDKQDVFYYNFQDNYPITSKFNDHCLNETNVNSLNSL